MAALGLGLAALGRPGYMTLGHALDLPSTTREGMEAHAVALCELAYTQGVRHFDVARSYGEGERFLARWLHARRPADVTVSSKWGYRYTADWAAQAEVHEVKEHSLAHLERQWAESRALLGRWLGVYQIHSATLESGVLTDRAVLERLAALEAEGVAAGLSVTGPKQAEVVRAAMALRRPDGRPLFGWVQATWNPLETSAGPALAEAKAAGVSVIVKEPLANGRLGPRGDATDFLAWAADLGLTPDALALALALRQPWADVVLSGAATEAQLRSNLAARAVGALPHRDFSVPREAYWQARAGLRWT